MSDKEQAQREEEPSAQDDAASTEAPSEAAPGASSQDATDGSPDNPAAELAELAESSQAPAAEGADDAPAARPARGSSFIAWLALLLALGLAGGAGWSYLQVQQREAALLDRLSMLEGTTSRLESAARQQDDNSEALAAIDSVENRAQQLASRTAQLETALRELQSRPAPQASSGDSADLDALSREWDDKLAAQVEALRATNRRQQQQMQQLASELAARSEEPQVNINRDAWLLAEVQYLLRLANQRIIMAGDTVAAGALLASADSILRELDDITLLEARRAVADDLAAVRAVPSLDMEGMYLKLGALIKQADALVIFELPDTLEGSEPVQPETWQERLLAGWQSALQTLSSYIVVRRRDTPMEAMMDPHWERMVRQNLRMLLEQSQIALLTGNQLLFQESLQRTRFWVAEFFVTDEAAARALSADLEALMEQTIAVELPDISGSVRAFDAAMERKLGTGGAG